MSVKYTENAHFATDGVKLSVQRWAPAITHVYAELLVIHGYGEHGGRYREFAHRIADHGIATTTVDIRGHGRSHGRRGHVKRFADYYNDVEVGLAALNDAPHFILGHSHGGLITLDYIAQKKPKLTGVIVSNPYLDLAIPVSPLKIKMGNLFSKVYPRLSIPSGLPVEGLSHDKEIVKEYVEDPLVFGTATAGWFEQSTAAQKRVKNINEIPIPLLFCYSDSDPIASPNTNKKLANRIVCRDKLIVEKKGELHEILNEINRAALHDQIRAWILERAG